MFVFTESGLVLMSMLLDCHFVLGFFVESVNLHPVGMGTRYMIDSAPICDG